MMTSIRKHQLGLAPLAGKSELSDADLLKLLDNPDADETLSRIAVQRAIDGGMSPARAKLLYGGD